MDINYLREFIVVGESTSMLEASRKVSTASSTLSRHIAALEDEVGFNLIDRTAPTLQLTDEGVYFLNYAREVTETYRRAIDETFESTHRKQRKIVVGGHMRLRCVSNILGAATSCLLRQKDPVLLLPFEMETYGSVTTMNVHDPTKDLLQRLVDLSLVVGDEMQDAEGFTSELIASEPLSAAIPVQYAPTGDSIDLLDYKEFSIVMTPFYMSYFSNVIGTCRDIGFDPAYRFRHYQGFGDLCAQRRGGELILLDAHDAAKIAPPEISGLVAKRIRNPEANISIYAVWSDDKSDVVKQAVEQLHEVARIIDGLPLSWSVLPG